MADDHGHGKKPAATKPRPKAGRRPTKEHWRRDIPNFYNFLALDRAAFTGEVPDVVGGLSGALMSRDTHSGSHTFVAEFPAKYKKQFDGKLGALEIFVLRGALTLNGEAVASGGHISLPQGCGGGEVRSADGALALIWWNPNAPAYPPPYTDNRILRVRDMEWVMSLPDYHGLMHKSLRLPDPQNTPYAHPEGFCADGPPGGYLRYTFIAPGIKAPYEHVHHECFEEIIMLGGDTLLADEGIMAPGTVVCHPQEWWHGPFASRSGALIIVHTDAPMGYPWPPRDYPFQEEVCNAYMDETPFDVPAQHTPWEETPWVRYQQKDKFKKWAATKAAAEYGDVVGRGYVSKMRGSITRHDH